MHESAKKLVDEVLGPLIAADGGQIELIGVGEHKIIIRLTGTCAGCPGRPYTLSRIIEPAAKHFLGDDVLVETIV